MAQSKQATPYVELLDIPTAAARLGCSRATVYRLIAAKAIAVTTLPGRGTTAMTRISSQAVAEYIETHTTPALRRPA